jgi:hypothetical protein
VDVLGFPLIFMVNRLFGPDNPHFAVGYGEATLHPDDLFVPL